MGNGGIILSTQPDVGGLRCGFAKQGGGATQYYRLIWFFDFNTGPCCGWFSSNFVILFHFDSVILPQVAFEFVFWMILFLLTGFVGFVTT